MLIEAQANPHLVDANERSPLHIAVWLGYEECTQLLLAAGADLTAKDKDGKTPLDYAKQRNNQAIIQMLAQHEQSSHSTLLVAATLLFVASILYLLLKRLKGDPSSPLPRRKITGQQKHQLSVACQ